MELKRNISGVFARRHRDDPEMIELYSKKGGDKTIVWACIHSDMLWEMKGRITPDDLDNHEYEILIHFPGGVRE